MALYTVLDAYGTPIRWGECPLHLATAQADTGETLVYEHPPTPDSLFVDGQWVSRPPRPARYIGWDSQARQWIVPEQSLEDAKAQKNDQINAWRLQANRGWFMYAGKQIACDELSRSDIDGVHGIVVMTGAMPPNWLGAWKAMDNTYVPIADANAWGQFYSAMVSAGTANFVHSQSLKAAVDAAASLEELASITW